MSSRRKAVWIAGAAGVPIALVVLAWFWWVPAWVRGKAEATAAHRLGMRVTVGDVSLRLRGVVLSDVVLYGAAGGVEVRIDEIGVRADLLDLVSDGASAITHVQARSVDAAIDLTDRGAAESLAAIALGLREVQTGGSAAASPRTYEAADVSLVVEDEFGRLVHVTGVRVEKRGDQVIGSATDVSVGAAGFDEIDIHDSEIDIVRRAGTWLIERLHLGRGELVWASRAGGLHSSLMLREGEPRTALAEDDDPASTFQRLRYFGGLLRSEERRDGAGLESGDDSSPWLRYLIPTFQVETEAITVSVRRNEGDQVLLRDLRTVLAGLTQDTLHARGSGVTSEGGELHWDLQVAPASFTGEGEIGFRNLPLAVIAPFLPELPWHEPEQTFLEGRMLVQRETADRVHVDGSVAVSDLGLASPRLAARPIRGMDFRLSGEGTWDAPARRIVVDRGSLTMGGAIARFSGALTHTDERYAVHLEATLPLTSCDAAIHAIPRDVLGPVSDFGFLGTIGAQVELDVDSTQLGDTVLEIDVADGCEFAEVPGFARMSNFEDAFLHRVRESDGSFFEMTTGPTTGNWTSIHAVSPFLIHAVVTHEDGGFFAHGGFAVYAIRDALVSNLRAGHYRYGASTITMQLAKNLFLNREKTLARKVQEVILTWWLEESLDKDEILELYLNIIEYGPAVYGIRHASRYYFGRRPRELSPAEACFLAAILPSPAAHHRFFEDGALDASMKDRLRRMLRRMHSRGRIGADALSHGLAQVDRFRFRQDGVLAEPRELPDDFEALPFAVGEVNDDDWQDSEEEWEEL